MALVLSIKAVDTELRYSGYRPWKHEQSTVLEKRLCHTPFECLSTFDEYSINLLAFNFRWQITNWCAFGGAWIMV